jgi:alpha-acetolactate decarboxylase
MLASKSYRYHESKADEERKTGAHVVMCEASAGVVNIGPTQLSNRTGGFEKSS